MPGAWAVEGARVRRLVGGLLTGLVVAMMIGALLSGAQAATSGPQVGVVGDITWGTSPAEVTRSVSAMVDAGVGWVRAGVAWSGAEADGKGMVNQGYLAEVDAAVNQARAAGLQVLMPLADGVPYWASGDPAKYQDGTGAHWNKYWRSTRTSDYADFVGAMVARYQAVGVHTYELWNEPNLPRFWPSGPNAAEFQTFLAAAYPAAKAADPTATVLMGGLAKNDYDFLGQLYVAGGRPYFDAVAVHPYTGSADPTWCWNEGQTIKRAKDAFCGIEEVRNTMVAAGDSAKPMWLTEFGWSTTTAAYGVSEATQADYLTKAFTKLQSYPYVAVAFWYSLRNVASLQDAPADYEANLGLLRTDFTAKPAYAALRSWTGAPAPTTTTAPSRTTSTTPAGADVVAPVASNVRAVNVGRSSAAISWTTNEASDSQVDYWAATPSAQVADSRLVLTHSLSLTNLSRGTTYSYRVRSRDSAGNTTLSPISTFKTLR